MQKSRKCLLFAVLTGMLSVSELQAATEFLSDQLPPGKSLADLGLGSRPLGPSNLAVRVEEWAVLPTNYYCQQIVWQDDALYLAIKNGLVLEFDLDGNQSPTPFLELEDLRFPNFRDSAGSFSGGLRGLAFHPDYATNGLVYTMHKEAGNGSADLGIVSSLSATYILGEWDMDDLSGGEPAYREVIRVGFGGGPAHRGQQIGFNPVAQPGDPDYGKLYCCFGDNTDGTTFDSAGNGQNFSTILASVIRIDPLDPSGQTDQELALAGLKRSATGKYAIPLSNPFVGQAGYAEEIFAKGFRNPLSFNFSPTGIPMIADVGERAMEEINLLESGGNYGWGLREGTFAFTHADQTAGDALDADDSLTWVPFGDAAEPAEDLYFRDRDGSNLRVETVARTGIDADGFLYPVAQFSHEGNNTTGDEAGRSAVIAGEFYSGYRAEELEGLYVFGNFTMDTLFYVHAGQITNDQQPATLYRLPLVDANGQSTTLEDIIGQQRVDMRFGRDRHGNLYLSSKTNFKVYRLEGSLEMQLDVSLINLGGTNYPVVEASRPLKDGGAVYTPLSTDALGNTFSPGGFQALTPVTNGTESVMERFRYLTPFMSESQRFFRIDQAP